VPTREELLRNLRAIGDPLRLRMLVLLAHPPGPRCGPVSEGEPGMCVSDLRARLGRAHALVSHHVQVLLRAGLIRRVRRGRWSLLQLDTARVAALGEQIASLAGDQFRTLAAHGELEPVDAELPVVTARVAASSTSVHPLAAAHAACNGAGVAGTPSW
jgi:DNA-binding transcriptional ArsR family regulator